MSRPLRWYNQGTYFFFHGFTNRASYNGFITQSQIKLHSNDIPPEFLRHNFDTDLSIHYNYTIIVSKRLRQSLSRPYNKKCNDYSDSSGQPLAVTSHTQCVRNCIKEYSVKHFNCTPLFIDGVSHESDFNFSQPIDNRIFCSVLKEYNRIYYSNNWEKVYKFGNSEIHILEKWKYNSKTMKENCVKLCPKDCLTIDYSTSIMKSENLFGNQYWFDIKRNYRPVERTVVWDTRQPMFAYIQQPVITFTDYLVCCGGLIGLWFGASAQDLLLMMIDNNLIMVLRNIMKNLIVLIFYILKQTKIKFFHYLSIILSIIKNYIINPIKNKIIKLIILIFTKIHFIV